MASVVVELGRGPRSGDVEHPARAVEADDPRGRPAPDGLERQEAGAGPDVEDPRAARAGGGLRPAGVEEGQPGRGEDRLPPGPVAAGGSVVAVRDRAHRLIVPRSRAGSAGAPPASASRPPRDDRVPEGRQAASTAGESPLADAGSLGADARRTRPAAARRAGPRPAPGPGRRPGRGTSSARRSGRRRSCRRRRPRGWRGAGSRPRRAPSRRRRRRGRRRRRRGMSAIVSTESPAAIRSSHRARRSSGSPSTASGPAASSPRSRSPQTTSQTRRRRIGPDRSSGQVRRSSGRGSGSRTRCTGRSSG